MVQRVLAVRKNHVLEFDALNGLVDSISSRGSYDNSGNTYNISRIINADASFNAAAYQAYSPLFLSYVVPMLLSDADAHHALG